ncbi:MAG: AAA family ATPase [Candidatus Woesearchaeota archaeon]
MSFYLIIRGPLGCGKSTISEKLAVILNAKHFSVDKVLEENNLEDEKEEGYISQKSFRRANEIIAPIATKILDSNKPVIFDGNFYWKSQIEDLISRMSFPHYVFTLKAPLDVCIERDKNRVNPHGEGAAIVVYKKTVEFDYGIIIDINRPLDDCINDMLSYLEKD